MHLSDLLHRKSFPVFLLKHRPAEAQKRVIAALSRVQRAENERINKESNSVHSGDKGDASSLSG